jgi:protein PhnA
MTHLPDCPQCGSKYTYTDETNYICPECACEWPQAAQNQGKFARRNN